MSKHIPRIGTCGDCGETFTAGKTGPISPRCPECREVDRRQRLYAKWRADRQKRYATDRRYAECAGCGVAYERHLRDTKSTRCPPCRKTRKSALQREWKRGAFAGEVNSPAGRRLCIVCGATPDAPHWEGLFRRYCSRNCAQLFRYHGGNVPDSVPCGQCGVQIPLLVPVAGRRRRRSDTRLCAACVKHARTYLTAADLAVKDGTECRLCGESVDMDLKSPNRRSATVDHIIPRALGGSDDPLNLQLAHRGCNSSKRHLYAG